MGRQNVIASLTLGVAVLLQCLAFISGPAFAIGQNTDPHNQTACTSCHSLFASAESIIPISANSKECRKCHSPEKNSDNTPALGFHADSDRNCVDCHSYHHRELIQAGSRQFRHDPKDKNRRFQCLACHDTPTRTAKLTSGHKAAAAIYHSSDMGVQFFSPSEACLTCHSNHENSSNGFPHEIMVKAPKFDEQTSHPFGVSVNTGKRNVRGGLRSQIDSRIPLLDNHIECQTCHELSGETGDQLRDLGTPKSLCLGCHLL